MSRTRLILALGVVAAVVYHCQGSSAPPPAQAVQAAVLADGYTVKLGKRVFELEPSGVLRTTHAIDLDGDVRVVGSRVGPVAGWQNGRKLELVSVESGRVESTWGKSVRHLCDGVATNDVNFGIGWLESDDSVWVVHGPVDSISEQLALPATSGIDWCGVASAGKNIALFWRERDALKWQFCSRQGCKGLPVRYDVAKNSPVLGLGCLADACVIASNDRGGAPQLAYVTGRSKIAWTAKLPAKSAVSIVGVDNGFAVGYETGADGVVVRFDRTGKQTPIWKRAGEGVPALAWSRQRLLVSVARGTGVVNETFTLSE